MGGPLFFRFFGKRIVEVLGDGVLDLVALGGDPHHQEEGHHRRDEVGVSHFPSAAAFAKVAAVVWKTSQHYPQITRSRGACSGAAHSAGDDYWGLK